MMMMVLYKKIMITTINKISALFSFVNLNITLKRNIISVGNLLQSIPL